MIILKVITLENSKITLRDDDDCTETCRSFL